MCCYGDGAVDFFHDLSIVREATQMDIIMKLPVLLVLGFIVFTLGQGMYFLAKDDGEADKTRVVRALTVRITLSLILFGLLILGYLFGLLQPHGL
jgi:hypothetical protein